MEATDVAIIFFMILWKDIQDGTKSLLCNKELFFGITWMNANDEGMDWG